MDATTCGEDVESIPSRHLASDGVVHFSSKKKGRVGLFAIFLCPLSFLIGL